MPKGKCDLSKFGNQPAIYIGSIVSNDSASGFFIDGMNACHKHSDHTSHQRWKRENSSLIHVTLSINARETT